MAGLEGLKAQILTMSMMKGDSTYNMIYSFLIETKSIKTLMKQ